METRPPKSRDRCNGAGMVISGSYLLYEFPMFALAPAVLKKVVQEKVQSLTLITPAWHTQPWYLEKSDPLAFIVGKQLLLLLLLFYYYYYYYYFFYYNQKKVFLRHIAEWTIYTFNV